MQISKLKEELANSITHGLGVVLGIIGIPILISYAVQQGVHVNLWGVSIFSFSLLVLYLSSTLYHSIQHPEVKPVLRILDHMGIYFLIAGSYTPFIFFYLNTPKGQIFLGLLWASALLGAGLKIFFTGKFERLSTAIYVIMGWTVVFIAGPIFSAMPDSTILWVAIGGASYTIGVIFYRWKKLPYHHAIWHLFVLGGTTSHYVAIFYSLQYLSERN